MGLSDYERQELDRLIARRAERHRRRRLAVPQAVRARLEQVAAGMRERVKDLPGSERIQQGYLSAAQGLGKVVQTGAGATLSSQRVIRRYRRAGVGIAALEDIHNIDLREVDRVAPFLRIRMSHALAVSAEGGVAGLAITGGSVAAGAGGVAGIGAGSAPGLATVAAALVGDTAAVLAGCARVAAETALYYGYDPNRPEEEIFLMSVIGLAMAPNQAAKTAAYGELGTLTQMLARNAPWTSLNEKVVTKVAQRFAAQFGQGLTKKKLGQFVPAAGVLVGAGANYWVVDQTAVAAYEAYRERYLREKDGGLDPGEAESDASDVPSDEVISVLRILEDVAEALPDDADDQAPSGGID